MSGVTADVPFAEYQRLQGVNWSTLSAMRTSPLKYRETLDYPKPPTAPMELGSAIHAAVLEPDVFAATYALYDGRRAGAAWDEWQEAHPGVTALKPDDWERCMGAAYAIHKGIQGRIARRIMRVCRAELTMRWTDPQTRIRCKARPDLVGPHVLADLKTTGSVDARKFGRLAGDLGYHGKMAFASMGLEALGKRPDDVYIIAVEQSPPHDVGVFRMADVDRDDSEIEVARLLRQLKLCRRRRRWPGRCENTQLLELPPWTFAPDGIEDIDISGVGLVLAPKEG